MRGVPVSPQRAPTPQGCPASHTPAGVFAGGGGDAYSPQDLPLPPLRPRARARSETRSDEKRYFPAQLRRARLGWRWSPGTRSRLRDSPPRPAGSPLPGTAQHGHHAGWLSSARRRHVGKATCTEGCLTVRAPHRDPRDKTVSQPLFPPGDFGFLFKTASKASQVPRSEGGQCPAVQTPPPGPGERPSPGHGGGSGLPATRGPLAGTLPLRCPRCGWRAPSEPPRLPVVTSKGPRPTHVKRCDEEGQRQETQVGVDEDPFHFVGIFL